MGGSAGFLRRPNIIYPRKPKPGLNMSVLFVSPRSTYIHPPVSYTTLLSSPRSSFSCLFILPAIYSSLLHSCIFCCIQTFLVDSGIVPVPFIEVSSSLAPFLISNCTREVQPLLLLEQGYRIHVAIYII